MTVYVDLGEAGITMKCASHEYMTVYVDLGEWVLPVGHEYRSAYVDLGEGGITMKCVKP